MLMVFVITHCKYYPFQKIETPKYFSRYILSYKYLLQLVLMDSRVSKPEVQNSMMTKWQCIWMLFHLLQSITNHSSQRTVTLMTSPDMAWYESASVSITVASISGEALVILPYYY